ncbi:glycosyltransferase family 39 protein [Sulfurimonas sp. HSL-1716]|uniref:ArnT family glycosyltransferase n=1 Tax=Hydrocurvibacter sulfurireducens TaxID=3131937 RepID=UPI0031F9E9EB
MKTTLYDNPTKNAYLLIIFLAIFSAIYNAFLPLHGDEAYYWVWSRHLQAGYYDHPPMIAFMLYLTNFISQNEWGVRLVNVFSMSIAALYIFKLTKMLSDEKTALNALIIFSSVILTHAGYIITTPDSPLILFWSVSMYYTYRALFIGEKKDFILTGLFLGLLMLSKYTAILYIAGVVIFMLLKRRDLFLNPYMYLSMAIAALVVSPMLFWNYKHDWISFTFQLHHGSTSSYEIYPHLFFDFFGGQFGIFSPVFTAVLFFFLIKDRLYFKDDKLFFISLSIVVTLLFFMYKSLYTRMALNYSAPAYIAAAVLLAVIISKYEMKKTFKAGLIVALIFTILGRIAFLFFLPYVQERMYGNKEAVELLAKHAKKGDSFYGDHLTIAAYLTYYLPGHPDADLALPSRYSQYDMWRKKGYLKDGLVLTRDPEETRLKQVYKDVKEVDTLTVTNGLHSTKTFHIYRVKEHY